MIKIGITGQSGFVGTHLFNTLCLDKEAFETIHFDDHFFSDVNLLEKWVSKCDVIVHLAALNRHNDPEVIYNTNILLVKQLITALEKTNSFPHVLFSSSTQEELDTIYGESKKEGRKLLEYWAQKNNTKFSGLVIPNVYGPFGNPYYNSVVATFCHQLTHNENPQINVNNELKLIYVGELVNVIINEIHAKFKFGQQIEIIDTIKVNHTVTISVSDLLKKIESLRDIYFNKGEIPSINNEFERNLFYTFLSYIDHKIFFPYYLTKHTDNRGSFVETMRLGCGGQISFSATIKGVTRGNHFHTRKTERFAVIKGDALIELRKIGSDEVLSFNLNGEQPSFVDMPVWYTHNIKNIGTEDLYTIFWINEFFDPSDPDTYFEKV